MPANNSIQNIDAKVKELKGILSQVDSLMSNGQNSPETVAQCQRLMGYATAINLPQEQKNRLIGQFPPRIQQMYKQVAKSNEAKTAQRGAMQQAMEVAMAQKHNDIFVQNFNQQFMAGNFSALQGQPPEVWNSCLLNSSINDANSLNVAIQNGWDINAKHKNPDGTESTYVEYQGAQIDKGIEGANRANATIKDLIGKHPRSKEEEEEYRKAQQVAENHHKNIMGSAQNVVNAIKSDKLNQEEMAKAQAELRKIEEYEKEQRRLAQEYRDMAAKETDPHRRAELLAQAGVHDSRANEARQLLNSVEETTKNQSQIKNTERTDSHSEAQDKFNKNGTPSTGKNNQEITSEQLNKLKEAHQALGTNAQSSTVNLSNQVDVDKPIVAGTKNQNPHLGKNPVDMKKNSATSLAVIDDYDNNQSRMAQNDVDTTIQRNSAPTNADQYILNLDTPVTIHQSPNTQSSNTLNLAQNTSGIQPLDLDIPITPSQSQNTQTSNLPSLAQNTSSSIPPLDMDTLVTPAQSQNIQAPKVPSLAQNTTNIQPLDMDTTISPTQPTVKTSSGLSNTIRSIASIVPDNTEINTENNVKPLDTSRVV